MRSLCSRWLTRIRELFLMVNKITSFFNIEFALVKKGFLTYRIILYTKSHHENWDSFFVFLSKILYS